MLQLLNANQGLNADFHGKKNQESRLIPEFIDQGYKITEGLKPLISHAVQCVICALQMHYVSGWD